MEAPAVAVKFAVVAFATTVTEAGTVRSALLLESDTVEPPVGAAVFRLNEQLAVPLELRLVGPQVTEETAGTAITPEPAAEIVNPEASASAPSAFDMATVVVGALGASVIWMSAATPDVIVFALRPVRMQVYDPATPPHEAVLPAAVATAPGVTDINETWLDGYVSVHCKPAGAVPETERVSESVTVAPGLAVADERLRLEFCASRRSQGCAKARPAISHFNVCRRIDRVLRSGYIGAGSDWIRRAACAHGR